VQEQRGMLRVWNVTLVIVTFFLTIFGTFMTRSGIVQSVHAFGQDPVLTQLFSIFMVVLLVASFGLLIYRAPLLRARNELDSWMSREAAFMANNWILVFSAFFVLFATIFPTISEAFTGERLTVGPPFFNQWMLPIGLTLLALTGIGPLLAWRKSTFINLRDQFLFPVFGTIVQEYWRGARVRQGTTGTDMFTALIGLVGRNKRRYGGYIVHTGIVLVFLGFAGEGFKQSTETLLLPGQQVELGDFTLRLESLRVTSDTRKQAVTATVTILRDGAPFDVMYPAKWYFHSQPNPPTTEVAIRRGFAEDVYVVLDAFDVQKQEAGIQFNVNPLVNWIWVGIGVMALGTFIALLPETAFAFATVTVPSNAATTSMLVLGLLLFPSAISRAQGTAQSNSGVIVEKSELQEDLEGEIQCTCGGCNASLKNCPMPMCHGDEAQTTKLKELIAQGLSREEILAVYVRDFGTQAVLSRPIDRGFNRLAWAFPYLVAGVAGIAIFLSARRWSSRPAAAAAGDAGLDSALDARLDDELRSLD
jgi:cytochrome c-type biogenesis protein CcmF